MHTVDKLRLSIISIHVLRVEDDDTIISLAQQLKISIHVLRVEDDLFLCRCAFRIIISIHVLRVEDDPVVEV